MKQIYVAYTPYHLLLSCGLACLSRSKDDRYLLVIPVYSDVNRFCRCLTEWGDSPFSKIIMLNGIYDVASKIRRVGVIRNNIKIIKNFFSDDVNEFCEVFIFNDGYPEAQIIARLNHDKGGFNTYVEDGSAAYNSFVSPDAPIYKKIIYRLVFGAWHRDVKIMGTYKYIDKAMVAQPEFVRPELSCKDVIKMPKNVFNNLKSMGFISILFKNYGLEQANFNPNCILIVSHSDILSEELSDTYRYLVKYLLHFSGGLYVKYHPREREDDFLGVKRHSPEVELIPKALPLEAVFVALQDENMPDIIVGDLSTSLLTARYLLKVSTVISIMKFSDLVDKNLENIFKITGVYLPEDIDDLKTILETIEGERTVTNI